ncbi:mitochondrial fission factor-like isoform X1 [Symsagittifera roscoffensis]|uniref:mitochondrial fission factor-like isoform X1 n=1 Tax=Symsagittifera roscoffensis TaxID=84072 RepID=UPI00307C1EFD
MTSESNREVSSTGDLSDFEYESSVYDPMGGSSNQFGSHLTQQAADPFSLGPSLGSKMNVPDTIALLRDDEMQNYRLSDKMFSANQAANMSIPDRISLGGNTRGDFTGGGGGGMMGSMIPGMPPNVTAFSDSEVITPPRHLKLGEFAFPSVPVTSERPKTAKSNQITPDTSASKRKVKISTEAVYNDSVFQSSPEDVLALRKQVLALSRKVAAIEQDNKSRVIRENYYMYSLACLATVTLYLMFRR